MPTTYHVEEQDVYGELLVMRRRLDDLERSARRLPMSSEDGAITITGDFAVTGSASFDTDSLEVGGGPVRAIEVEKFGDSVNNASLTTSTLEVISVDLTPPNWAEEMLLTVATRVQFSSGNTADISTIYSIDSGSTFDGAQASMVTGFTHVFTNSTSVIETAGPISLPTAFSIDFNAVMLAGTNSTNDFRMDGHVFWMRAA